MSSDFERRLTLAVASLREGEVVSFGDIAAKAGKPNAPRAAGSFLSKTKLKLPWWRVVYSNGSLPQCDVITQKQRLQSEGVVVSEQRIVSSPLGRFRIATTKHR